MGFNHFTHRYTYTHFPPCFFLQHFLQNTYQLVYMFTDGSQNGGGEDGWVNGEEEEGLKDFLPILLALTILFRRPILVPHWALFGLSRPLLWGIGRTSYENFVWLEKTHFWGALLSHKLIGDDSASMSFVVNLMSMFIVSESSSVYFHLKVYKNFWWLCMSHAHF